MPDELNESATQSLEERITARFDRLEALIVSLANQVSALQTTVNEVARNQREMYVDLRRRDQMMADQIEMLRREVRQLVQDQQPDSIASRLLG